MKLTIAEIARQARVSKGTVSRVINGHDTVASDTRELVLSVMKRLGYEPDPVARELSRRSKHTLGIWVGEGTNRLSPYFNLIWRAVLREMQVRATQFVELPVDITEVRRKVDAILLFETKDIEHRLELLAERRTPAVLIGHYPGVSCVMPDDQAGGAMAASALLERHHRAILHLGASESFQWARERALGFQERLQAAGIEPHIARGEASILGGYRLMRDAWKAGQRPTAVFCATDEMAIGALGALEDLGVEVPSQVSVMGFDGLVELRPGLATIAQDIPGIAHRAISMALEAIGKTGFRHEVVPVAFLDGDTLGALPAPARRASKSTR